MALCSQNLNASLQDAENCPCLLNSCPFETIRLYRKALLDHFGAGVFETEHPFVIKVVASRSSRWQEHFDSNFACVGVNTLPQKQKLFLDAVLCQVGQQESTSSSSNTTTESSHKRKAHFSGHSGRNTAITYAMADGVPESNIAVSSGHADVNTLRAYAEPTMDTKTSLSLAVSRQLGRHQEQEELRERLIQGKDDGNEEEQLESAATAVEDEEPREKHRKLNHQGQNVFNFYIHNK